MNINKAIELLSLYEHASASIPRDDFLNALLLGRNALQQIAQMRVLSISPIAELLDGETEE